MKVNPYKRHVWLIPEDDDYRQLANGFITHWAVDYTAVGMRGPASGWLKVLDSFEAEYVTLLRSQNNCHVIMLIDFDKNAGRRAYFEERIPEDVKPRVFLIGPWAEAKDLTREFERTLEEIGQALAQECSTDEPEFWKHSLLDHNSDELNRMISVVKPFLFQAE